MNNKLAVLSCVILVVTSANAMHQHDSEFEKMMFAERASRNRTHGFQGCVNQAQCGETGFYAEIYSPEGLCTTCELKKYPERFIACPFCRRPEEKFGDSQSSPCLDCSSEIQKLLIDRLKMSDDWQHVYNSLRMGAFSYLHESEKDNGRKFIAALETEPLDKIRAVKFGFLGIYLGAMRLANGNLLHVWNKKLEIAPSDKWLVVTEEQAKDLIGFVCNKYKVFGPETGEQVLQEVPVGSVTYEEIVAQQ